MAVDIDQLKIIHYPDARLRQKAEAVRQVTDEVRQVAARMIQLMHEAPGVGLAAPQVGLSWRMFVANPTGEPGDDQVYVNPEFKELSRDSHDHEEGCLSLPGITGEIRRPTTATLVATDLNGNRIEQTDSELLARIWQHENDHLDGVLIIDKMTPIDRMASRKILRELEAEAQ